MIGLFIFVAVVKSQELLAPSILASGQGDYDSNQIRQYLEEVNPEPTKKGPVLFPNDAPPPPRPPLVVTSRPLSESIARSELNNSIADSSYINTVTYRPNYGSYNNLGYTNKPQYHNELSSEQDYNENQNYAFSYTVKDQKTGDDFSHKQQSVGSATNGEYRVRLPDGRMQIVSYTADDNGYNANVRYDEQAVGNPTYQTNANFIDNTNYNLQNEFNKPAPTYTLNNNLANSNYDFSQVNYRDEIPVKENQYDSKEYYDYSAENYKNELYNPVSTLSPYINTLSPFVQHQQNYQTTPAPYQQNLYTTVAPYQNSYTTAAPLLENSYTSAPYNSHSYQYPKTSFASTTVRPSYDEIKDLFTTPNYKKIEINSPSSYSEDDVVLIGNKNVFNYDVNGMNRESLRKLNDRINAKPVLSNSYIDRINKYLTFK